MKLFLIGRPEAGSRLISPSGCRTGKDQLGFTLLEIMIAIVILTIGVLGVASMQTAARSGNFAAQQVMEADNWAAHQLEIFMLLSYDAPELLGSAVGVLHDPEAADGGDDLADGVPGHRVTWVVADDVPMPGVKTIQITVRNHATGRRVVKTSYKADL
jgi:prepilin-type N-terminal cleavage/methylation domain-containing protein